MLQRIHDRHRIPAHSPAPKMQGLSRVWITPALFPAFIPGMNQQPGYGISRLFLHQQELPGNFVKPFRLSERLGILRKEGGRHIQSIEPHLERINLFVPKSALACSRVSPQLGRKQMRRLLIPRLPGLTKQREKHLALINLIEIILFQHIRSDAPPGSTNKSICFFM